MRRIIALALIFFLSSCKSFMAVKDPVDFASYLSKIETYNGQVKQLKATLDIKGRGIIGSFFHEEADIVVKAPDHLFWSLRSFFGTPSLIVAFNGQWVTMHNFLSEGPSYHKFSFKNDNFELLGLKFHPESLIYLLLAQIPLGLNLEIKASKDLLEISSIKDNWQRTSVFNLTKNQLLKTKLVNISENMSYQATYGDFADGFPTSLILQIKGKTLEIRYSNIDINGESVSEKAFYLEPQ